MSQVASQLVATLATHEEVHVPVGDRGHESPQTLVTAATHAASQLPVALQQLSRPGRPLSQIFSTQSAPSSSQSFASLAPTLHMLCAQLPPFGTVSG